MRDNKAFNVSVKHCERPLGLLVWLAVRGRNLIGFPEGLILHLRFRCNGKCKNPPATMVNVKLHCNSFDGWQILAQSFHTSYTNFIYTTCLKQMSLTMTLQQCKPYHMMLKLGQSGWCLLCSILGKDPNNWQDAPLHDTTARD